MSFELFGKILGAVTAVVALITAIVGLKKLLHREKGESAPSSPRPSLPVEELTPAWIPPVVKAGPSAPPDPVVQRPERPIAPTPPEQKPNVWIESPPAQPAPAPLPEGEFIWNGSPSQKLRYRTLGIIKPGDRVRITRACVEGNGPDGKPQIQRPGEVIPAGSSS